MHSPRTEHLPCSPFPPSLPSLSFLRPVYKYISILWANTSTWQDPTTPQHTAASASLSSLPMSNSSPSAPLQSAVDDLVRILHQPSPPSLRELLEAYSVKGNGDRELLLAMLSAKSSEDQRLAAVIQSHQTLIQAHAAAQTQMHQQHLLVHYQQPGPGAPQRQTESQTQTHTHTHANTHLGVGPQGHLLSPSSAVIAPPSPSGTSTSQSHSSSSSPRLATTLPPIHSHLADLRSLPTGPTPKRRRTERDTMMLESIGNRAGPSRQLDGERRGRGQSQMQSQTQAQMNGQSQRGGRGTKMMVDEESGGVGEKGEEGGRGSPGRTKREQGQVGRDEMR